MHDKHPSLIVRSYKARRRDCSSRFACIHDLLVAVRGGDHSIASATHAQGPMTNR